MELEEILSSKGAQIKSHDYILIFQSFENAVSVRHGLLQISKAICSNWIGLNDTKYILNIHIKSAKSPKWLENKIRQSGSQTIPQIERCHLSNAIPNKLYCKFQKRQGIETVEDLTKIEEFLTQKEALSLLVQ